MTGLVWVEEVHDVFPEVLPVGSSPRVVALKDRDDVLVRAVKDAAQRCIVGFHSATPTSFSASFTRIRPESNLGSRASRIVARVEFSRLLTATCSYIGVT